MSAQKTQPDLERGDFTMAQQVVNAGSAKKMEDLTISHTSLGHRTASGSSSPGPNDYQGWLNLLQPEYESGAAVKELPTPPGLSSLEVMHRLNVQQAKIALYLDYFTFKLKVDEKIESSSVDFITPPNIDLQSKILRYSKATADYKAFAECECELYALRTTVEGRKPKPFNIRALGLEFQDRKLLDIAARTTATEQFRLQLTRGGASKAEIEDKLKNLRTAIEVEEKVVAEGLCKDGLVADITSRMGREQPDVMPARKFLGRLSMALFGGLILIAPMLIMRLHTDLLTVVLTTSVFVVVVSIILANTMKSAESKDILGAAAAYAAVLVVFVGQGTVSEASSWSNGKIAGLTVGVIVAASLIGAGLSVFWWERKFQKGNKA